MTVFIVFFLWLHYCYWVLFAGSASVLSWHFDAIVTKPQTDFISMQLLIFALTTLVLIKILWFYEYIIWVLEPLVSLKYYFTDCIVDYIFR